ncbi:Lipase-like pad4 [Datura stramonium]|uniref:Lipase-like pad4 n=1 Tax=Datura stramonium TaxID=4076 RepID=A0ABS8WXP8_DATST|nr:Lipase-like pad4 [Datura stramonium]
MESEASSFESSETLAALVASTPLLEESWKVCGIADASVDCHFAVIRVGGTAYLGFSGVQLAAGADQSCRNLVPLPNELFSALCLDGPDPPMVHAGLLHLFLSVYTENFFRDQSKTLDDALLVKHSNICASFDNHDIVPRLFFAPSTPLASSSCSFQFISHLSQENKTELFRVVLDSLELYQKVNVRVHSDLWELLVLYQHSAICVDNGMLVIAAVLDATGMARQVLA